MDIPKGMINAADVVFFVFLVGGAFTVVDKTGALRQAVDWLAERLQNRRGLVIPVICTVFALGGALENLQEEIVAMVPVLLLLCRRLGFDPLTAAAMSIGAASVGSAFSPVNPFQAVIAQKLAGLPHMSGWGYRLAFLVPALALWIWGTHAASASGRPRIDPTGDTARAHETPRRRARCAWHVILCWWRVAFAVFISGCSGGLGVRGNGGGVFSDGRRGGIDRRARGERDGGGVRGRVFRDGVRGAAHRFRAGDSRRAGGRAGRSTRWSPRCSRRWRICRSACRRRRWCSCKRCCIPWCRA